VVAPPEKQLSTKYVSAWARKKRQLDLPEHEYTGKQNHCRACYHEFTRRWRAERMKLNFEPHTPVSGWHCRTCHCRSTAL